MLDQPIQQRAADGPAPDGIPAPPQAKTLAETNLNVNNLMKLALKLFYVRGLEGARDLADSMKLHVAATKELLENGKNQGLFEILGADNRANYSDFRYGLTGQGRQWAIDALQQNQYSGPAPVTLAEYCNQVLAQTVLSQKVQRETLSQRLSHLIVPPTLERRLGPALNSGRSLLLYGAPGNGKTTIAESMARCLEGTVYIPYAIEIEGEIIKVFDPVYHHEVTAEDAGQPSESRSEYTDRRWVPCHRPIIVVGGELNMDMLNLHYSQVARFYEAPLQMKANGGTFLVDDLGRQFITPTQLLNRWIVPMERRIDYLGLQNGTSFSVPFDNLLIFSTNLDPTDLMDPAFLRRIPYKVEVLFPSDEEFGRVFDDLCRHYDMALEPGLVEFAIDRIRNTHEQPLAFYQPKFILDQIVAFSKYEGKPPALTRPAVEEALQNIATRGS